MTIERTETPPRWVGVVTGDHRRAFVSSAGFVRTVDNLANATLYENPSVALIDAQSLQIFPGWVTSVSTAQVTVAAKYVAVSYDAEHTKRFLSSVGRQVETLGEAAIFDDHESAMRFVDQAVNASWSHLQPGDEGTPRPPRITHGAVEEVIRPDAILADEGDVAPLGHNRSPGGSSTLPRAWPIHNNKRTNMREVSRQNPRSRQYGSGASGRQSPHVTLLLSMIEANDPIFGRVLLELPRLRGYGVELTQEILANVIQSVRDRDTKERGRKARDPQVGSELVATSKGAVEERVSVVYYAQLGNRVKIGTTGNLRKRMQQVSPEKVLATEPGGTVTERQRHRQFADLRVTGEWFRLEDALVAHINELRKAWKP